MGLCATAFAVSTPASAAANTPTAPCQDSNVKASDGGGHARIRACGGHIWGFVQDDKGGDHCVHLRVFWTDGAHYDSQSACLRAGRPKADFNWDRGNSAFYTRGEILPG
jgi:hypothetical protein